MSAAATLRERLALLREMNVAVYNTDGKGRENVQFFPPHVAAPTRSAKEIDDEERARAARLEAWEQRTSVGASGGLRETQRATSAVAGGGSVNPNLNDAIRRERVAAKGKAA